MRVKFKVGSILPKVVIDKCISIVFLVVATTLVIGSIRVNSNHHAYVDYLDRSFVGKYSRQIDKGVDVGHIKVGRYGFSGSVTLHDDSQRVSVPLKITVSLLKGGKMNAEGELGGYYFTTIGVWQPVVNNKLLLLPYSGTGRSIPIFGMVQVDNETLLVRDDYNDIILSRYTVPDVSYTENSITWNVVWRILLALIFILAARIIWNHENQTAVLKKVSPL